MIQKPGGGVATARRDSQLGRWNSNALVRDHEQGCEASTPLVECPKPNRSNTNYTSYKTTAKRINNLNGPSPRGRVKGRVMGSLGERGGERKADMGGP